MNMVEIGWLMPLIGFVEIVGGVLFMIGRTRPLGAIIIFPIMVGILFTHITVAPSGIPLAVGLALVLFWVIVENRDKYKALVN